SSVILTKKGIQLTGLAAPQGDQVTVLQSDGTKVTLKKNDIDQQLASLVSVMPEKLLDTLDRREIADLFAYLESEPAKESAGGARSDKFGVVCRFGPPKPTDCNPWASSYFLRYHASARVASSASMRPSPSVSMRRN